jgi:hypothetical protein
MRELACTSQVFADGCLTFMVDMFNDETDSIRLHAITSISKVAGQWQLFVSDDILSSLLLILSHNDVGIQREAYKMMAHLRFTSRSIRDILGVLTSRLDKCETMGLMQCIAHLGANHADFIGVRC